MPGEPEQVPVSEGSNVADKPVATRASRRARHSYREPIVRRNGRFSDESEGRPVTDGGVVDDGIGLSTDAGDAERMNRARSSAQALVEWSIRAGVNPVTILREELEEREDVDLVEGEDDVYRVDTEGSA